MVEAVVEAEEVDVAPEEEEVADSRLLVVEVDVGPLVEEEVVASGDQALVEEAVEVEAAEGEEDSNIVLYIMLQ